MSDTLKFIRQLDRYLASATRRLPDTHKSELRDWSLSETDALILGLLLECCPPNTEVLSVTEQPGPSALYLAAQPKVSQVVCTGRDDIGMLAALLQEFPEEGQKITLSTGDHIPEIEPGRLVLALVDRLHTRRGVRKDLAKIFDKNPYAAAILAGCRNSNGPFVQAGVADFMEDSGRKWNFWLLAGLSPSLAPSSLGVVAPGDLPEFDRTLEALAGLFTVRLDPLRLLERESELIDIVNAHREEISELQERNKRLMEGFKKVRENNARLTAKHSSWPYRLADAVVRRVGRISNTKQQTAQDNGAKKQDSTSGDGQ
jgi:hypothetical protein